MSLACVQWGLKMRKALHVLHCRTNSAMQVRIVWLGYPVLGDSQEVRRML